MPKNSHELSENEERQDSAVVIGKWRGRKSRFRADQLVVGLGAGVDVDAVLRAITDRVQSELQIRSVEVKLRPHRRWAVLSFQRVEGAESRIPELAVAIAGHKGIRYANPTFVGRALVSPDDDKYQGGEQSWVDNIGLPSAWDITTGSSQVLIAVIDSGISMSGNALDHPDLDDARITVGNCYVTGATMADEDGHGTHVTGIVAADSNNNAGVVGVNWVSPVHVSRVIKPGDDVELPPLAAAIEDVVTYAESQLTIARVVVNLSLMLYDGGGELEDAFAKADASPKKFLFVCGAHSGWDADDAIAYPAIYAAKWTNVIAVGGLYDAVSIDAPNLSTTDASTDPFRAVTLFSYGVDILSTLPGGTYGKDTGPSMATPMVAGVASLVWSVNADLSAAQVRQLLVDTADKFTPDKFTYRRLNARVATAAARWFVQLESSTLQFVDVAPGAAQAKSVVFVVDSATGLTFEVVDASEVLGAGFVITNRTGTFTPGTGSDLVTGIVVEYTGTAAGDVAFGRFDVRCVESGQNWTVYLAANTVPFT